MNIFQHKNIINHIVASFYITNDKFDKFFHPVVLYENYRICISMNNNENFSNERKYLRKIKGCTNTITCVSSTMCSSVSNLVPNQCLDI